MFLQVSGYQLNTLMDLMDHLMGFLLFQLLQEVRQVELTFCIEVEDAISMSLTAIAFLLEKCEIDLKQIGWLEIGSEL